MASAASFVLGKGVLMYMKWEMPELTEQHILSTGNSVQLCIHRVSSTTDQICLKHFGMALGAKSVRIIALHSSSIMPASQDLP